MGATSSSVAACFSAAGAWVATRPAGPGTAVYAFARDGAAMGFLEGPNVSTAAGIARVFSSGGSRSWKTERVKSDPLGFSMYKGKLRRADSAVLSKCTRRPA